MPKIAWIIGGGSGIGAAVARELAAQGFIVAISGRREQKLAEVARSSSNIRPYPLDVTESVSVARVLRRIVSDFGRIDLMLYGAVATQPKGPGDYNFAAFAKVVDTNLMGLVRMLEPLIAQLGRQRGGQLAVIASVAGYVGLPRAAAYSATKAALISLCQTMRAELSSRNVDVRLVTPGFVKSELTDRNDFPMPFLLETDDAARRIVRGLTRSSRFEIAFPWQMVLLMKTLRLLPSPLFFAVTRRMLPKAQQL